jgi:hypothetical protein
MNIPSRRKNENSIIKDNGNAQLPDSKNKSVLELVL